MDIEQSQEEELLDFEPLTLKNDKKLKLSHQAESLATNIISRRTKNAELNRGLDPNNTAQKYSLALKTKEFGDFQHFLTKNKHRDDRIKVMEELRYLAQERGITLVGKVKDKLERSRMVVRVLSKQQANGIVIIEDESGKEKMQVKLGTVYVGMIACIEVSWVDGCYKLEQVLDLSHKIDNLSQKVVLKEPNQAYGILFLKGSFSRKDSKQHVGIKILMNQIKNLREKERNRIDCVVIFGPLLHCKNTALTKSYSELTFEEETTEFLKLIKDGVSQISKQIEVVLVPSTDDLTNLYPIPQPKYKRNLQVEGMHYTSNPGLITLTGRQNYEINLINTDILQYIDENRTGHAVKEVLQDNLDVYFKQPFLLTNAHEEPFDETNLNNLYNEGKFGNIVVISSNRDAPFAREVRGRVFVNIGSLGIDHANSLNEHYMALVSIYDGEGPVCQRVKVESLRM